MTIDLQRVVVLHGVEIDGPRRREEYVLEVEPGVEGCQRWHRPWTIQYRQTVLRLSLVRVNRDADEARAAALGSRASCGG